MGVALWPLGLTLWPLAKVWSVGARARVALYQGGFLRRYRLGKPVVSVGNLSAGGTGKTPFVLWLWRELERRGIAASVLTRGYRREDRRDPLVFNTPDGSQGAGDEVRLLLNAGVRPVGVAFRRELAGLAVESDYPVDLHLLDDGFQHLSLVRALDIVLLDCTRPPWEYELLPAGRLREPLSALARADIIILTRAYDWTPVKELERQVRSHNDRALLTKATTEVLGVPGAIGPVFAFAGIGNPKAFFDDLGRSGVEVAGTLAFSDHHRYTVRDLERIAAKAGRAGAQTLVTTEKDAINLPGPTRLPLAVAGLKLLLEDGDQVVERVCAVVRK